MSKSYKRRLDESLRTVTNLMDFIRWGRVATAYGYLDDMWDVLAFDMGEVEFRLWLREVRDLCNEALESPYLRNAPVDPCTQWQDILSRHGIHFL